MIVGIRPESIEDAALARSAPEDRRLKVVVELCEAVGPEVYAHFPVDEPPVQTEELQEIAADVGDDGESIAPSHLSRFVGRLDPKTTVTEGREAEFVVDTTALHFFDAETGRAV